MEHENVVYIVSVPAARLQDDCNKRLVQEKNVLLPLKSFIEFLFHLKRGKAL